MKIDERLIEKVERAMNAYYKRFEGFFGRSEPREQGRKYIHALVTAPDRRNGWELAMHSGDLVPDRVQRLLYRSHWDENAVRDEHILFAKEHLGSPEGVFIHDETGFLKSGKSSAGVQRQYTGTAGKVTNCQVGVFQAYSSPAGCMLTDRALYIPASWLESPQRCKKAGIPKDLPFQTKPVQALRMLQHAVTDLGVPGKWVTADEVYGNCPTYRKGVCELGLNFVAAVSSNITLSKAETGSGKGRPPLSFWPATESLSAEVIARNLPDRCWKSLVTKAGERGPIRYLWASVRVMLPEGDHGWLLVRRSLSNRDDMAFYLSNAAETVSLKTLARVALRRAEIEQCFAEAKTEAGLDEYEVRLYGAWNRHITLAMMAHAFLVATKKTLGNTILRIRSAREGHCKVHSSKSSRTTEKRILHELDSLQNPKATQRQRRTIRKALLQGSTE